jgi:hypothetical protein
MISSNRLKPVAFEIEWKKYLNKNPDIKKAIKYRIFAENVYKKLYQENRKLKTRLERYHVKFTHNWSVNQKKKIVFLRDIKNLSFSEICPLLNLSQAEARSLYQCSKQKEVKPNSSQD